MINHLISEIKITKKEIRKFGIVIGIILLIVGVILLWKRNIYYPILMIMGIFLFVGGLSIPIILKPIYIIWMIFATIMGWLMTRFILSLLFYGLITPISLIARLMGKKFIYLRWDKINNSYWNYRSNKVQNVDYEKQY
ncbi:uncharacterized protein METZ01_LOCUS374808 [marine metagenome]|uniref:SxtJ n=1 Tax=marine metagenome TaxID=408172 RepID=A0A382TIK8_9ZZZZ